MSEPRPPRLPRELDEDPLEPADLRPDARIRERRIFDARLAGVHLAGVELGEVHLSGGDLSEARIDGGGLADALLERVNLANLRARGASLRRVELRGCRMTGLQWAEGSWRDVLVTDARADLCALRYTTLHGVTFRDCVLTDADLVEARLREVRLERCSLERADLSGARFERVELRGCRVDGWRGVQRLDGVAMPWPDIVESAGALASALGVRLLDDD